MATKQKQKTTTGSKLLPPPSAPVKSLADKSKVVQPVVNVKDLFKLDQSAEKHGIFGQDAALQKLSQVLMQCHEPATWSSAAVLPVLLYGPTSCGKTAICRYMIQQLGLTGTEHCIWFDGAKLAREDEGLKLLVGPDSRLTRSFIRSLEAKSSGNHYVERVLIFDNFHTIHANLYNHFHQLFEAPTVDDIVDGKPRVRAVDHLLILCLVNDVTMNDSKQVVFEYAPNFVLDARFTYKIRFDPIAPSVLPDILRWQCRQAGFATIPEEFKPLFTRLCQTYDSQLGVRQLRPLWQNQLITFKTKQRLPTLFDLTETKPLSKRALATGTSDTVVEKQLYVTADSTKETKVKSHKKTKSSTDEPKKPTSSFLWFSYRNASACASLPTI